MGVTCALLSLAPTSMRRRERVCVGLGAARARLKLMGWRATCTRSSFLFSKNRIHPALHNGGGGMARERKAPAGEQDKVRGRGWNRAP